MPDLEKNTLTVSSSMSKHFLAIVKSIFNSVNQRLQKKHRDEQRQSTDKT